MQNVVETAFKERLDVMKDVGRQDLWILWRGGCSEESYITGEAEKDVRGES
jgi:hypothetical protein